MNGIPTRLEQMCHRHMPCRVHTAYPRRLAVLQLRCWIAIFGLFVFQECCDGANLTLNIGVCNEIENYDPFQPLVAAVFDEVQRSEHPFIEVPYINDSVTIRYVTRDTACNTEKGQQAGVEFATPGDTLANVVFGCSCSSVSAVIARIGTVLPMPQISWISASYSLTKNQDQYKYFMRTMIPLNNAHYNMCMFPSFFEWPFMKFFHLTYAYGNLFDDDLAFESTSKCEALGVSLLTYPLEISPIFDTVPAVNGTCDDGLTLSSDGTECEDYSTWAEIIEESMQDPTTIYAFYASWSTGVQALHIAAELGLFRHVWYFGSGGVHYTEDALGSELWLEIQGQWKPGGTAWTAPDIYLDFLNYWWYNASIDKYRGIVEDKWLDIMEQHSYPDPADEYFHYDIPNLTLMLDALMTIYLAFNKLLGEGWTSQDMVGQRMYDAMLTTEFDGFSGRILFNQETGDLDESAAETLLMTNLQNGTWVDVLSIFPNETGARLEVNGTTVPILWPSEDGEQPDGVGGPCLHGQYFDGLQCSSCPSGQGLTSNGLCEDCAAGRASSTGICDPCQPGHFANETGMNSCTICPAGAYCGSTGLEDPLDCPLGYFAAEPGSTTCESCPVATYNDKVGSVGCESCVPAGSALPGSWTSLHRLEGVEEWVPITAATSASQCGCARGSFRQDGDCHTCGEGLTCLGETDVRLWEGYSSSVERPYFVWACFEDPSRCPGGLPGSCAENRDTSSLACTLCLPGTRPGDGVCQVCSGTDYIPVVIGCILVPLLICLVYYMAETEDRTKQSRTGLIVLLASGQLLTVYQQLGVLSLIDLSWPEPLASFLRFVSLLSFDLDIFSINCMGTVSNVVTYSLRICCVLGLFCLICIIHVVTVLAHFNGNFLEKHSTLVGCVGSVFVALMLSIVTTIVAPLHCQEHPNGKYTMRSNDGVICWLGSGSEHEAMVIISIVTCILPITFLAVATNAVARLPGRLRAGDAQFLHRYFFLFSRFRLNKHWYVLWFMIRNFTVAMVPVLPGIGLQWATLMILIIISAGTLVAFKPWRAFEANILDIFCTTCLLVIVSMAALLVEGVEAGPIGVFLFGVTTMLIGGFVMCLVVVMWRQYFRRGKTFQFFLCHHKATAGNLARLCKMHLLEHSRTHRKVFVDSDDLQDLTQLFNIVQSETETLVVLCSAAIFTRPWCLGEMTTAFNHHIRVTRVLLPDAKPLDENTIDSYSREGHEYAVLTEFGMTISMLQDALRWLNKQPTVNMEDLVTNPTIKTLVHQIITGRSPSSAALDEGGGGGNDSRKRSVASTADTETRDSHRAAVKTIVADTYSVETMSTACILEKMLVPLLVLGRADISITVLQPFQTLPKGTNQMVVVCTNGIFEREHVIQTLLEASKSTVDILPVVAESAFRFPTTLFYSQLKQQLLSDLQQQEQQQQQPQSETASETPSNWLQTKRKDVDILTGVIEEMFKGIAVEVNPQDNETVLNVRVKGLALRLQSHNLDSSRSLGKGSLYVRLATKHFANEGSESRGLGASEGTFPLSSESDDADEPAEGDTVYEI